MPKSSIFFYDVWPDLLDYTKKSLGHTLLATLRTERLSTNNLDPKTEILVVFIDSFITEDHIKRLPNLRLIVTMSTGYDHIDLAAAKKRGIVVCNVPTYGENTVAEHTFGLILALSRKLFESVKRVKEGSYDFRGLRGIDVKDKTLGIIGVGHIGAHVARMANGFEMRVLAYDIKRNQQLAKKFNFTYVSLRSLLQKSDIVTLHLPLFPSTYHLINKSNIALMKPGALLINTARGGLVDPEALLEALKTNHLAGAGLDVLEDEQLLQNFEEVMRYSNGDCKLKTSLANNLLIDLPNVIVTPHNAFNSTEALQRIITTTIENIRLFLQNKPENVVKFRNT